MLFQNPAEVRTFIETDLPDPVLQTYMDDAEALIVRRYGPNAADLAAPLTRVMLGGLSVLYNVPAGVTEIREGTTVLVAGVDYRVVSGGYLERLPLTKLWATRVEVDYQPEDDTESRRRVAIDLCKLAIEYTGLDTERIGDYSYTRQRQYVDERRRILSSLRSPGLVVA